MLTLRKIIESHHKELAKHRLFALLQATRASEPVAHLSRALSFWPMAFQDVLRLNAQYLKGTELEHFGAYERDENAEHDNWFLHDLKVLDQDEPQLGELFGPEFQPLRDACYTLLAEVHRAQSPAQRVAFLLALEPTGRAFFEQMSAAVDRLCGDLPLRYFARSHLTQSGEYDLFSESIQAETARLALSEKELAESTQMVKRVYETFDALFNYLAERAYDHMRQVSDVRELGAPRVVPERRRAIRS
jgi:hypothetical protein